MERKIDCRGPEFAQPGLEANKPLEGTVQYLVLANNQSSEENVKRFAESQDHKVSVAGGKGVIKPKITKETSSDLVIFIDTDSMGRGSEELGKIVMRTFLQTLEQSDVHPKKIILMNGGVKLACQGSEVLEDLQELGKKGVEILACGKCLDFFGIKRDLNAGKVSDMYEILNSLTQAGRVLKI